MTEIVNEGNFDKQKSLDELNAKSWYANPDENKTINVAMSVNSVGPSRETNLARTVMAGNMSLKYGDPTFDDEARRTVAANNVNRFIEHQFGVDPNIVRIMRSTHDFSKPLVIVNAGAVETPPDAKNPIWLNETGDFIYTLDPEIVLAVKPGDCPVVIAAGKVEGQPFLSMTHIPRKGAEAGYVDQMLEAYDSLGVDRQSLRIYLTGSVQSESYPHHQEDNPLLRPGLEQLYVDVNSSADGFDFNVDIPGFIRNKLKDHQIEDYQVFVDDSDTARLDSGYASHSRVRRTSETEERYMVVASIGQM